MNAKRERERERETDGRMIGSYRDARTRQGKGKDSKKVFLTKGIRIFKVFPPPNTLSSATGTVFSTVLVLISFSKLEVSMICPGIFRSTFLTAPRIEAVSTIRSEMFRSTCLIAPRMEVGMGNEGLFWPK